MQSDLQLVRLDPDDPRPDFDCGNDDLNAFFTVDSIQSGRELISVSYVLYRGDKAVAYYCVSNDAIRREDSSKSRLRKILERVPRNKWYHSMPAVKIGRFAVCKDESGNGFGSMLLARIKYSFTHNNKTGCRFIIVDAYDEATCFYQKNGFEFLSMQDKGKDTRLMYFDLITFRE